MLTLNIKALLLSKGIDKPYPWLKKLGISHQTAYKLLHKPSLRVPIQLLSKICEAAYCTPSDLFVWTPSNAIIEKQQHHPLQALRQVEETKTSIASQLIELSPAQLHSVEEVIKGFRK